MRKQLNFDPLQLQLLKVLKDIFSLHYIMDTRSRAWTLTHNNYSDDDISRLEIFLESQAEYGIYGKEEGDSGTPHLQIYFRLKNAKSFRKIKKLFPTCHIEVAKSDAETNFIYCSKDNYKQFGTLKQQGKRTDLIQIKDEILQGRKVDDITLENPTLYHQYGRTLNKIEDLRMRKLFRNFMTEGIWYYGTSGTGKSEKAFENFNPETHYVWKYENGGWQDGYTQQETIIIDEFRGQLKYCDLLMMIDKHPNFYVPRRGREPLPFVSKKVIITSALQPHEVYHNLSQNDSLDQLLRRIKVINLGN